MLATLELARRLTRVEVGARPRPASLARHLAVRYWRPGQEVAGVVFLDGRDRLIDHQELFRGTAERCAVEPRPVLRAALGRGAGRLVFFHTHPSGDCHPSFDDLELTRDLRGACAAVGIPLVDHLILGGPETWASLRESRLWHLPGLPARVRHAG